MPRIFGVTIYERKAKTFNIIGWSMLTRAGCNTLAAKEPHYGRLLGRVPKPTALRKRPSADASMVSVNGNR